MSPSFEMGTFRTEFGSPSPFTTVSSTGGFYVIICNGVELDLPGLSRFNPNPRAEDPADEDVQFASMRKLGATFYPSDWDYSREHNPMIKNSKRGHGFVYLIA